MLFNSHEFIFLFFPLVLAGFFCIGRRNHTWAAGFLALASLVFYGWWSLKALPLMLGSIGLNYLAGAALVPKPGRERGPRGLLALALAGNLVLLGVFKYANFFIVTSNDALRVFGMDPWSTLHILLPIGISFYTFTQIAFLVDCWQGKVQERRFIHYLLFVTYFPHLVAGPILHHAQMMPQFANPAIYRPDPNKIVLGLAIFVFGLAKKLLLADPLGQGADLVFNSVRDGDVPSFGSAWVGVVAYALQLYFDFSGYSDMAIGLSLCLGVQLPINFDAPYKSTSIIEFWRRWHISLSNFLRDYLYFPLGGNRLGKARRHLNLLITMVLGGLWHGAAWTFVLWGALHGLFLVVNHLWRQWRGERAAPGRRLRLAYWALTFLCVSLAWVLFRADSLSSAGVIYKSMLGLNGITDRPFAEWTVAFKKADFYKTLVLGLAICLAMPTTPSLARFVPRLPWARLGAVSATLLSVGGVFSLFVWCLSSLGQHSPFLYFQF